MISIIIPIYNASEYLSQTLDSIRSQGMPEFEVILVDDGSTDGSADICKRAAEEDARFHVISRENAGVAAARNEGLAQANGEYVMFVDADDLLAEGALQAIQDAILRTKADILSYGWREFKASGDTVVDCPITEKEQCLVTPDGNAALAVYLLSSGCIDMGVSVKETFLKGVVWNSVFRRELIRENALHFFSFWNNEDDWIFDITAFSKAKTICLLPRCLYRYRLVPDSLSKKRRYVTEMYENRGRGVEWISGKLDELCTEEYRDAAERYKGLLQRKLLLLTLYNETAVEKHMSVMQGIAKVRSAVRAEKAKKFRKGYWMRMSKSEVPFAILLRCNLVATAYLLNRYVFKVYR